MSTKMGTPEEQRSHYHPSGSDCGERQVPVHFHFIPTSSSWLNLVERWFGEITRDRIRRGTFNSVPALVAAIEDYLQHYNEVPRRFIRTKDADMILDNIAKCPSPLETN